MSTLGFQHLAKKNEAQIVEDRCIYNRFRFGEASSDFYELHRDA